MTRPSVSLIIPAHNAAATLRQCLESILSGECKPEEIVVVDDRSTDMTVSVAQAHRAIVVASPRPGPAAARNAGARHASQDILFFVDADVCLHPDAIARVKESFRQPEGYDAIIGSYDDSPAAPGLVSQYRNLLHHFVHQTGSREASTFWAGCGAISRPTFLAAGGFDETYSKPSVEDIEFGYRLKKNGKAYPAGTGTTGQASEALDVLEHDSDRRLPTGHSMDGADSSGSQSAGRSQCAEEPASLCCSCSSDIGGPYPTDSRLVSAAALVHCDLDKPRLLLLPIPAERRCFPARRRGTPFLVFLLQRRFHSCRSVSADVVSAWPKLAEHVSSYTYHFQQFERNGAAVSDF